MNADHGLPQEKQTNKQTPKNTFSFLQRELFVISKANLCISLNFNRRQYCAHLQIKFPFLSFLPYSGIDCYLFWIFLDLITDIYL